MNTVLSEPNWIKRSNSLSEQAKIIRSNFESVLISRWGRIRRVCLRFVTGVARVFACELPRFDLSVFASMACDSFLDVF
jgi:hypothetical protein